MIPKKIHYCWFGGGKKSLLIEQCISSWGKFMPEFEIIEWNESNFDISINAYVEAAFKSKKWAFVSDYVRAFVLYNYGGVYLDTDVEIRSSLVPFLNHGAFSGFEKKGFPFTAVWGAKKQHSWVKHVLEYYNNQKKFSLQTNTQIVSKILIEKYKVKVDQDVLQKLKDDVYIYPASFFCLNVEENFAVHHFEGSWLEGEKKTYSALILHNYYKEKFIYHYSKEHIITELYDDGFFTIKDLMFFLKQKIKRKIYNLFKM